MSRFYLITHDRNDAGARVEELTEDEARSRVAETIEDHEVRGPEGVLFAHPPRLHGGDTAYWTDGRSLLIRGEVVWPADHPGTWALHPPGRD